MTTAAPIHGRNSARDDVSPRSPTQEAQEPAKPSASAAMSMALWACRGRRDGVDELGAAGAGRTRGAGQGGDVDSMSAQGGVDALSGSKAGGGGIVADRMVEPVNGAGKRGRLHLRSPTLHRAVSRLVLCGLVACWPCLHRHGLRCSVQMLVQMHEHYIWNVVMVGIDRCPLAVPG
jgi:hypothetical protein